MSAFPELPGTLKIEAEVLERWSRHGIPKRCREHRPEAERFVFYEGPPTANGKPGLHHVFGRTLKDTVCRHRLMRGYHVPRRAGWDTQGLPVEIEVQKTLGIGTRQAIEEIGIEAFNRLCRESVFTYIDVWLQLSERMGYWLDYDEPYVTLDPAYIESCWAILSRFHGAGLMERDFKVQPYCPRCATGLSNHEVAQGYQTVEDPSVYVRFAVEDAGWSALARAQTGTLPEGEVALLVWTTTPWTLFANVAVAANPDVEYALVRDPEREGSHLLLARSLVPAVLGEDTEVLASFPGSALGDLPYRRPFEEVPLGEGAHGASVRLADFVSDADGTGFVHIAPAFGLDDFELRLRDGLPIIQSVDGEGRFRALVPDGFRGRFALEANSDIIEALREAGKLFRHARFEHNYPHCWRCRSPLLYMARPSWYLRTTRLKDEMVRLNETIDWQPPEVGQHRFGDWLSGNVDWAISRDRYWGTPLNIWECESCEKQVAPESFAALAALSGQTLPEDFDPHRPFIDAITLECEACGGRMRRTPEVADCWFDSGAMPFAQAGWPRRTGGELPELFPADFISEGLDQTRGWFYTLHAISTILTHLECGPGREQPAYRACLVNNLLLDADGKKMSKSRGNVVDPWDLFGRLGADAVRWYFLSSGQVWLPKRFDVKALEESARRVFGTLRNCYAFLATYANADGWTPRTPCKLGPAERPRIDRWLLARLGSLTKKVDAALQRFALSEAVREIEGFIQDELSNWYVRRNRARFWRSENDDDKRAAYETLRQALEWVALMMAPMAPFTSDWLWGAVTSASPEDSVHMADWPAPDPALEDDELEASMGLVLEAVGLGRALRASHQLKLRQPLSRCMIKPVTEEDAARLRDPELAALLAGELNVRKVEVVERSDFQELSAKPNFPRLGKRLGPKMKAVAAAVREASEAELERYEREGSMVVEVDGEPITLSGDDVILTHSGKEGYAVSSDGRMLIAFDTHLDASLEAEGRAREIVNRVQNARKSAGLAITDTIALFLDGDAGLMSAAERHRDMILSEVVGRSLHFDRAPEGAFAEGFDVEGAELRVGVQRVES